ncbi:MAG: EscU/YscU/HrcU family type III secretion system export apparatus switch protein [Planctomycetota bacterium]
MSETPRRRAPPPNPGIPAAIALRYEAGQDTAPRVLAKGRGEVAERILAIAREHDIPLHEDQDLVRLLLVLDLDIEIPPHMYRALAEVLAHVYRVNQQDSTRRT